MNGGTEPDYRFTLANERTFLAWARTALAILAGAMILHQIGRLGPRWAIVMVTCALAGLSSLLSIGSYRQWRRNQLAMRYGQTLPASPLVPLLAIAVAILGAGCLLVMVMQP